TSLTLPGPPAAVSTGGEGVPSEVDLPSAGASSGVGGGSEAPSALGPCPGSPCCCSASAIYLSRSSMILCWSARKPSISASGRGGQPGTYTSTGMILSTPCSTRSYRVYGPPFVAHAPIEITHFGFGICS